MPLACVPPKRLAAKLRPVYDCEQGVRGVIDGHPTLREPNVSHFNECVTTPVVFTISSLACFCGTMDSGLEHAHGHRLAATSNLLAFALAGFDGSDGSETRR